MSYVTLILLALLGAEPHGKWPSFLGAGATPLDAGTIPLKWSPEELAWTTPLPGYGQSSPVIWDGKVYLTSIDGDNKEKLRLFCLNLADGKVVWETVADSTFPQKSSYYISRAAPTPVVDANGVYSYFESGDVLAVNHSGEKLWSRSLTKDYGEPKNEFGLSASPVQLEDRLIILVDDDGPSYLVALSKKTGDVIWKTDRTSRRSWVSPSLVPFGNEQQLVVSSAGSVTGYNTSDGKQLWEFTEVGGNTGTTPTVAGDGAFLVSATAGREAGRAEAAKKSNGLMIVEKSGETWTPRMVWTTAATTPSWGSPIAYQGLAYWVNRTGVVYCFDNKTGELVYNKRLQQGCWATPVGIGNRIYIFGKDGLTSVISAGKEFEILAENLLWSPESPPNNNNPPEDTSSEERKNAGPMFGRATVYGAAIVDRNIVLRTGSSVFCVRQQ